MNIQKKQALSMKGISIVIYGSDVGQKAKEIRGEGSELVTYFLARLKDALRNQNYSWDFFKDFPKNRMQYFTDLPES